MLRSSCLLLFSSPACRAATRPRPKPTRNPTTHRPAGTGPEDVVKLEGATFAGGPVVTGVHPARAQSRPGAPRCPPWCCRYSRRTATPCAKGDVLVRLDPTAIQDGLQSAEAAVRNATLALDQAERNLTRLKTLRESGMTSLQALDDAEVRRNAAQSEFSAARARAVQARQQMERTVVRAPL